MARVYRIVQREGVDDYRAALFSVARSILLSMLEGLGGRQMRVIQQTEKRQVTLEQLASVVRLPRDKGQRGDGFEWAVHAAIVDRDPQVCVRVAAAISATSEAVPADALNSVLFGYERAHKPGFLDEFYSAMGSEPRLLPGGRGRSAPLAEALPELAHGPRARLPDRIADVWKADLFLAADGSDRWLAATVKSNPELLVGGPGLRVGIVAEWPDWPASADGAPTALDGLQVAVLPDHDGFVRIFNDGYAAIASALRLLGNHDPSWMPYYLKPTVPALEISRELERHGLQSVVAIADELNLYAQPGLVVPGRGRTFSVPGWLRNDAEQPFVAVARPLDFGSLIARR